MLQSKLISNGSQFETYKAQLHRDLLDVVTSLKGEVLKRFSELDPITRQVCFGARGSILMIFQVAMNENANSAEKMQNLLMENLEYKKVVSALQFLAFD